MRTLDIGGEMGRRVVVIIEDYERVGHQRSPDDANWLACSITAEIGRFRAEVEASLTTHDFTQFSSELDNVIAGTVSVASFTTMEEALAIRIEVDRAGRATISGTVRGTDAVGASLSFRFDSDLSFLRPLQVQLAHVVADFPIRQS